MCAPPRHCSAVAFALAPALLSQKPALALPVFAQRLPEAAPPRPKLDSGADTNDAHSYFEYGLRFIEDNQTESVRAFYWASRIDPSSAEALYVLRAARMMVMSPEELGRYLDRSQRKRPPEYLALDSLLFRAYTLNPFLLQSLERKLAWRITEAEVVHSNPSINRVHLNLDRCAHERGEARRASGRLPRTLWRSARRVCEGAHVQRLHVKRARAAPGWLARASEDDLLIKWTGAYVTANPG